MYHNVNFIFRANALPIFLLLTLFSRILHLLIWLRYLTVLKNFSSAKRCVLIVTSPFHLANFAFQSFRQFLTDDPAQKEAVMVRRVLMSAWGLGDKQMPLKRHQDKQPPILRGYFIPSSKKRYTSVCYISGFPENHNP